MPEKGEVRQACNLYYQQKACTGTASRSRGKPYPQRAQAIKLRRLSLPCQDGLVQGAEWRTFGTG